MSLPKSRNMVLIPSDYTSLGGIKIWGIGWCEVWAALIGIN